jgi:hypothetical protein
MEQQCATLDFVTFGEFLRELIVAQQRTHGWRSAYVNATHNTPGVTPVTQLMIAKWREDNLAPRWALDQITLLRFRHTGFQMWSNHEVQFLLDAYARSNGHGYKALADQCSEAFKRDISENAIKGQIDRLRNSGRLPRRSHRRTYGQMRLAM